MHVPEFLFRVHRSALLPALDAVIEAVDQRATIPILGNILLVPKGSELTLRATDLAIEVETSCELLEAASGSGLTVAGSGLRDIVKNLPENAEVVFSPGAFPDQVRIQSGRSRFSLLTLPEKDFPLIGDKVSGSNLQLEIAPLIDAFMRVLYAIREDKTRNYLSGAFLHPHDSTRISVVGCDGHNLAASRVEAGAEVAFPPVIVPIRTVKAVKKLFGDSKGRADVTISDAMIRIALNGVTLVSKLVDGIFPDYARVIPPRTNHAAVASVATFKAAVSRVCLVAGDLEKDTIKLQLAPGSLKVSMNTTAGEEAAEDMPVDYSGEPVEVGFNGRYLTAMLSSVGTQDVEMHLSDAVTPGLFRPTIDRDEQFVLMPRRL
ncbi:DNA polymerase III subunit beta [Neorhizobium sp. SOG26]|nr:DNA polymerase III subunit beta [Neorhizobium sp. SOG26]